MIRVLNNNFKFVNQIKKYTFSQYDLKFREIGTFEVLARLTDENLYLFESKKQYYVLFDEYVIGKINSVKKDSDSEYDKTITIKGSLAPVFLTQRVINKTITYKGNTVEYIRTLLEHCFDLNNENSKRYIKMNIVSDVEESELTQLDTQVTGGQLWDEIQEQLEKDNLGIVMYPNIRGTYTYKGNETNVNFWSLVIRSGTDRRVKNKDGNTPVIFSQSLSNINRTSYELDSSEYKNVIYVAAEGEKDERKWYELNINVDDSIGDSGLDRNELWCDARDLQSEDSDGNKMTTEEYENKIRERATEKASENCLNKTYETTVRPERYEYRKDYDIGDIVTVKDDELGVIIDAQITGITVSEQDALKVIDVTLEYGVGKKNVETKINETIKKTNDTEVTVKYLDEKLKSSKTELKQGTLVLTVENDDSVKIFDRQELETKFRKSDTSTNNYVVLIMNGDADAAGMHVTGTSWKGEDCYATFDRTLSNTRIRLNFVVAFVPTENIWYAKE